MAKKVEQEIKGFIKYIVRIFSKYSKIIKHVMSNLFLYQNIN